MIGSHLIPVFYLQPLANQSYRGKKHGLVWVYEKGQEPEERSLRVQGKQKATSQSFRTTSPWMTKPPRQRSPLLRTNAMCPVLHPKRIVSLSSHAYVGPPSGQSTTVTDTYEFLDVQPSLDSQDARLKHDPTWGCVRASLPAWLLPQATHCPGC